MTGILIGLGLAWYLFAKGLIPQPEAEDSASAQTTAEEADSEELAPATGEEKKSRYDFFTVLPEMEVVVPEQELSRQTRPEAPVKNNDGEQYILQVGSFKTRSDAEERKALATLAAGSLHPLSRTLLETLGSPPEHDAELEEFAGLLGGEVVGERHGTSSSVAAADDRTCRCHYRGPSHG